MFERFTERARRAVVLAPARITCCSPPLTTRAARPCGLWKRPVSTSTGPAPRCATSTSTSPAPATNHPIRKLGDPASEASAEESLRPTAPRTPTLPKGCYAGRQSGKGFHQPPCARCPPAGRRSLSLATRAHRDTAQSPRRPAGSPGAHHWARADRSATAGTDPDYVRLPGPAPVTLARISCAPLSHTTMRVLTCGPSPGLRYADSTQ